MILRSGFPLKLKAARETLNVRLSNSRGLRELSAVHENIIGILVKVDITGSEGTRTPTKSFDEASTET